MWKVFTKDLHEVLASRRVWLALLVLPLVLIALIGDISVRHTSLRAYVETADGADPNADDLRAILADLQDVQLIKAERNGRPIWSFMDEARIDIAVLWQPMAGSDSSGAWYLYAQPLSVEQDRTLTTLTLLTQAGIRLGRAWWVEALNSNDTWQSMTLLVIKRAGSPSATSAWLVPPVVAIVVSLATFLVASGAWARERDLGTLPLLAIAPRVGWRRIFLGKLLLPLLAGTFLLALSLLYAAALYRFGIKPGLLGMLALQTLAVLAVTLQGLFVSALVRSQFQAYLAAAVYLLLLLLLTGVFVPIDQGSGTVRAIAHLFPLSFAMPPLSGWLYFGVSPSHFLSEVRWLATQASVFGLLSVLAFWRLRRQF